VTRKRLTTVGHHGATVNVFADTIGGEPVVRCEWREITALGEKRRRTETFRGPKRDAERQAKAFAEGVVARLASRTTAPMVRRTVAELWEAYLLAHETDWRAKTATLAKARWKLWVLHVPAGTYADLITPETLDEWRAALLTKPRRHGHGMARNQVAHHIQLVKSVWKWSTHRKLLPQNPLDGYAVRKGRDYQPRVIEEYTPAEFAAILNQIDYRSHGQWRAWVAIALDGLLAPRSNALLQLGWPDLDMARRLVRWPAAFDKLGKVRTQPLSRDAVRVLRIAKVWARRSGYAGRYVLFGGDKRTRQTDRPWGYQALNRQLHEAAKRAGIAWKPYRAMHGLRRMVAKSVLDATGNLELAGRYIGDSDMRVLKRSYLRDRTDDLAPAVTAVGTLPTRDTKGNETATARRRGRAVGKLTP
jgi:site-specific recombinase XerD